MSALSQKSNLKKIRHIILAIVALGVFGVYAYKVYSFREEMTSRREEYSMDFLSKLSVYQNPRPASYHETLGAFDAKDFEKLESLAEKYCAERNDPKKDRDNIRQYFWVLGERGDVSKREQKIETVKTWRKMYPESVPARIAHVMLLIKSAWDARGSGYADSVSEEQFKIFHERLLQARDVLVTIPENQYQKYPEFYSCILTCARGLGVPRKQFNQIYLEGVKVAPKAVEIHYTAAHFSTVQWGAKLGEWEANLRGALKGLPKDDADEVYAATIYRMVNRGHWFSKAYNTVFKPVKIDPGRVINGLERIIARAPEKSPYSIYYRNALAHAVMEFTNDPMACRGALESAGWQIDTRVWRSEKNFDYYCREWLERRFKAYNDDLDEEEKQTSPLRFFSRN